MLSAIKILATALLTLLTLAAGIIVLHTTIRLIRHFHKFPMPQALANLIDNPMRRRVQPPVEMPQRHGLQPGMRVLEVGPGNGRYSVESARAVAPCGSLVTIDIEPRMIERVQARAQAESITNLEARTADVFALPFADGEFDAVYMITVIGEIPQPERALAEFQRVLKDGGTLAFSELFLDPDYPTRRWLTQLAGQAGFLLKSQSGNFFSYTLVFEKA
ncbi:MAG TPA: class I SAM-dependent methyltransferase [Anaerolineaceae bacterium]|jgi:ubiquinone/menaquinone biosynthesis C-methylase UbiE|nr:class I SAM-dependent methyltransferase [Anaerolineaceae bacterium]